MAATVQDETLSRSVMFLCLSSALLLLGMQWLGGKDASTTTARPQTRPQAKIERSPLPPIPANSPELVVDLSDRAVLVYQQQKLLHRYPVAIGQDGWETPIGSFRVQRMQKHPDWRHPITGAITPAGPDNPLGDRWIGFWSDGHGEVGFHGTNQENLIGQAVSHGCVRMRNQDVEDLYAQVAVGTPVVVRP